MFVQLKTITEGIMTAVYNAPSTFDIIVVIVILVVVTGILTIAAKYHR